MKLKHNNRNKFALISLIFILLALIAISLSKEFTSLAIISFFIGILIWFSYLLVSGIKNEEVIDGEYFELHLWKYRQSIRYWFFIIFYLMIIIVSLIVIMIIGKQYLGVI